MLFQVLNMGVTRQSLCPHKALRAGDRYSEWYIMKKIGRKSWRPIIYKQHFKNISYIINNCLLKLDSQGFQNLILLSNLLFTRFSRKYLLYKARHIYKPTSMAREYAVVSISSSDSFQPLLLTRFLYLMEVSFISVSFWLSIPPNFSLKLTDWYFRKKTQRIFSKCV